MRKALTLIFLIFGLSIYSQEERKNTIELQGLYLKKGNANFTYLGLGITKDAKKENFSNSVLLDLQYLDYNYSYGYHFLLYKFIVSKKYTFSRKHLFLSFGLGGGFFNYKSSDFSLKQINTGLGFTTVPSIVAGLKFNKFKIGGGFDCSVLVGTQKTLEPFYYSEKEFLLDFILNNYLKISIDI